MSLANTKKCQGCKKELQIELFVDEEKDEKYYSKCINCREKINSKYKKNTCEICGIRACFNYDGESDGIRCKEHKEVGMVDVKSKRCEFDGCKKQPNYNNEGETKAKYCVDHKQIGMVDVKSKRCEYDGCKKRPNYNNEGETKAKYCVDHKQIGMIDIKHKKCEFDGCKKRPNYNNEGETKAKYCVDHKQIGMVDINSKKCEYYGCKKRPNYNNEGEIKAKYCVDHKQIGMVNIKSKKCEYDGCKKQPTYNNEGEIKAKYCVDHKQIGMVDINSKRCEFDGCKKRPNYNNEGETKAKYCVDHKQIGMIDIKHKKCIENNCNTRAFYGYCGQSAILCAKHRDKHQDKNFLYTRPKRICIGTENDDCKEIATYGLTEPAHCEEHQLSNEICLIAQKCKSCARNELLNKEGLCVTYCHPNELYQQNQREKLKEKTTLNYLDKYIKNIKIISDDKIIPNTCNIRVRPDRIYDCNTHYLIIEVDENQHKGYSCEKGEFVRMHEIQNAAGVNCIFLRFNPDNFRVNGKLQKVNMNERLKLLVKWIEKCSDMRPISDIEPVKYKYLFYDDFVETDTTFKILDDLEIYNS